MREVFVLTTLGWYFGFELSRDDESVVVQIPQLPHTTQHPSATVRTAQEHFQFCVDLWEAVEEPLDMLLAAGTLTFKVPMAFASEDEARALAEQMPNPRADWTPTHLDDGYWRWTSFGELVSGFKTDKGWWSDWLLTRSELQKRFRRRSARPAGKRLRT